MSNQRSATSPAEKCLLCGSPTAAAAFPYDTLWKGVQYRYRRCPDCRTVSVSPVPDDAVFDALFDPADYHELFYGREAPTDAQRDAVSLIESLIPPQSRLLDFGCGSGGFLVAASARGFLVEGIERNPALAAYAAARCASTVTTLEQVEAGGARFALVHIADVLGHLTDPGAILRRLESLLTPGGIFLIEGPLERQQSLVFWSAAAMGWARQRLGKTPRDHPPYHLTLTTLESLVFFLEKVMGYKRLQTDLAETGWPYRTASEQAASLGDRARNAIGKAAIAVAGTSLGRRARLANRFRMVIAPQ